MLGEFRATLSYHIQSISKQLHMEIRMIFSEMCTRQKLSDKLHFQTS